LWARPGAYPRVEHLKEPSLDQALALRGNIKLDRIGLPGTNTRAIWAHS
jgi:hypothetical protein